MAYDEGAAARLREIFAGQAGIVEKKMFGGLAFMYRGHMCCGIVGDVLMARVGPEAYEETLQRRDVREMDFTGKPLRGFVYVESGGFAEDSQLKEWVRLCQDFTNSLPAR
jgi:hypothetical protein